VSDDTVAMRLRQLDDIAELAAVRGRLAANLKASAVHLRTVLSTPALASEPSFVAKAEEGFQNAIADWRAHILGEVDIHACMEDVRLRWTHQDRRDRYYGAASRLLWLAG
jgi:hypothetical protein